MATRISIYSTVLLLISTLSWGQKMKLKRANSLQGGIIGGERFDRVIGNVLFTQRNVAIYCDSAHFFKSKNKIDAFGSIRIKEGDSIQIVAAELTYDGNTKIAHLRRDIIFKKRGKAALYTDFLDYYRHEKKAHYFGGGKLIESSDTLRSEKGYYDMNSNIASFKKDVVGNGKEYSFTSDTIQYDTNNKIIFFRDSTTITNAKGDVMVYKSGTYNTQKKIFALNYGTTYTSSYMLSGDSYMLDELAQQYKVRNNVSLTLIKDSITIHGAKGDYDKKTSTAKMYGNPYLEKFDDRGDTLFIRADTLIVMEKKIAPAPPSVQESDSVVHTPSEEISEPSAKSDSVVSILLAYNNVKVFKTDLQGVADSLVFSTLDSTIYFFNNPVLWSGENQMTADSIRMIMEHNTISRMEFIKNPFMVSKDSLSNFNQMKGREMAAYFDKGAIAYIDVTGNGEGIYFVLNKERENGANITKLVGMNRIICSNIKILFKDEDINDINFYTSPEASFIPPFALTKKDITLQGFIWREHDKPTKADVVTKAKNDHIFNSEYKENTPGLQTIRK